MDQKISVIIPTADRPDSLVHALSSLRAQNAKNLQVVIVNDGGAEIGDVVKPFRDDLGVELINHTENLGPSAARNIALDAADGEFISFLDDDDVLLPGHFEAILPLLTDGGADFVYPTAKVSTVRNEHTADGYRDAIPAFNYTFDDAFLLMANYIPPAGIVFRHPGPAGPRFDNDVRLGEDWDLWLRMRAEGYRFRHAATDTAIYHRLPRHDHKADPAASESLAIHAFHQAYSDLCDRWAVDPGSPAAKGRAHVQLAYRLAFVQMDEHRRLVHPFWWENMLRALHANHTGALADAGMEAALEKAVTA